MTPYACGGLGSSQTKAVRSPAMPRRQKKAPIPENSNEALTLLSLQQQVYQLTAARATLANVLTLVHETPLYNFTSAQDRRTLSTAQSCLGSLCIRLEAHANTVEETVKQKQLAFLLRQRQATGEVSELPAVMSAIQRPSSIFQTTTSSSLNAMDGRGSVIFQ